jgi:hypothetical protein
MALEIKNSSTIIDPTNLKLKILIYGLHGAGKTSWMSTAPKTGIGVSETGWGKGLLSIATKEFDYVELNSYADFDAFCSGTIFKDKETLCLDSLSDMVRTFVKEKALSIPRAKGESAKRAAGVMELDDYGVVAELTRKLLKKFIDQPKHIIVTSGLRIDRPDPENFQGETLIGPDLAGQLFLGSTAMFDLVFCLRTRQMLSNPKDAKSRYMQRYIITESNGSGIIAKNRLSIQGGKSFLPSEVVFDPENNLGTFDYFYNLAITEYQRYIDEHKK